MNFDARRAPVNGRAGDAPARSPQPARINSGNE
jgi:hypothetical protein